MRKQILHHSSGRLLWYFVIGWFLMLGNSWLVALLSRIAPVLVVLFLQLVYLGLAIGVARRLQWLSWPRTLTFSWRSVLVLESVLAGMLLTSSLLFRLEQLLGLSLSTNQANLLSLLNRVALPAFILYLLIASFLEETIYRGFLFGLSGIPLLDMVLTSGLFALVHQPNHLVAFLIYWELGMSLAWVRHRYGLLASIILHCLWNLIVLIITLA